MTLSRIVVVRAVNLAGAEVLRTALPCSTPVRDVQSAAGKAMVSPACCIKLMAGETILRDEACLGEYAKGEELQLTATKGLPDVAGVYAAWSCSMLVLRPDGGVFYGWYDEYWEGPKKHECVQRSYQEWLAEEPTGTWSIDADGNIVGDAIEGYLDDHLTFVARIVHSDKGLVEGLSTLTLEVDIGHAFGGMAEEDGQPEKKTFYLVSSADFPARRRQMHSWERLCFEPLWERLCLCEDIVNKDSRGEARRHNWFVRRLRVERSRRCIAPSENRRQQRGRPSAISNSSRKRTRPAQRSRKQGPEVCHELWT